MEQKSIEKESEQPLVQVNVIYGFMIIAFVGIFIGIRKKRISKY
jgi:D-alanyl-D-alanine carboxypeptidase